MDIKVTYVSHYYKNSAMRDLVSEKCFKSIFLESAYSSIPYEWAKYIKSLKHFVPLVIYIFLVSIKNPYNEHTYILEVIKIASLEVAILLHI